ncbi:hypothetical protein LOD99_1186 [Oopsacas minuta]|uniref:Uncharacterized protein n=1 Tax=Oopsacas minuta TaxID=111878 RepID=A0AAV7K597_9METZ|nr:hypothetical protein LOD99_1186 [Oopsacas minuta]
MFLTCLLFGESTEQTKDGFDGKLNAELSKLRLSHSGYSRDMETQLSGCSEKLKVTKREVETLRNQLIEAKRKEVALVAQNETLSTQSATLTHKFELNSIGK